MSDLRSEAAQLLDVLADRLAAIKQHTGEPAAAAAAEDPGEPTAAPAADDAAAPAAGQRCPTSHADPQQPSCAGCPLCAAIAALRGERPELTARLVDGALSFVSGLRSLIRDLPVESEDGDRRDQPTGTSSATTAENPAAQDRERSAGVGQRVAERIDIR